MEAPVGSGAKTAASGPRERSLPNSDDLPQVPLTDDFYTTPGKVLAEAYAQHGPIFRAKYLCGDTVFLVGPAANRFVLVSGRSALTYREGWGRMYGVVGVYGDGLLTLDGDEHARARAVIGPHYSLGRVERWLPMICAVVRARITPWGEKGTVDLVEEMRSITFEVIARTLGISAPEEIERYLMVLSALLDAGLAAPVTQQRAQLQAMLFELIRESRTRADDTVLGALVRARDGNGHPYSDAQVAAHASILLVAGHETCTSLGAWLLYLLSVNPTYLRRVHSELAGVVGSDGPLSLDHIHAMTALDYALYEAERLQPPVANGPRGVTRDLTFAGHAIPAGAHVMYSIGASHLLSEVFADPALFDPDRFAAPREEHRRVPFAHVPYGGGPRTCVGIHLARVQLKVAAAYILSRYHLEPVAGQIVAPYYRATGMPRYGIRMHVSTRRAATAPSIR